MQLLPALPAVIVALSTCTLVLCFMATMEMAHYPATFPYISFTGDLPPESYAFAFGLSISGCLSALLIVSVYNSVKLRRMRMNISRALSMRQDMTLSGCSAFLLIFGLLGAVSLVSLSCISFHWYPRVHLWCLLMFFVSCFAVEGCLIAIGSIMKHPKLLIVTRSVCLGLGGVIFAIVVLMFFLAEEEFAREAGAVMEYFVVLTVMIAALSLTYEVRNISINFVNNSTTMSSAGREADDAIEMQMVEEDLEEKSNFTIDDGDDEDAL